MSKVSYKPYYTEKERRQQKRESVSISDVIVGSCAGLTARSIVKGMSQAFCEKQGVITKIGTAALGVWAAVSFGVKAGSLFYHIRSGAQRAYHDICEAEQPKEEKEKDPSEARDEGVKRDPTPDSSKDNAILKIKYGHPEEWISFSNPWDAIRIYTKCVAAIHDFGYVSVADIKEEVDRTQIFSNTDNVYGWSNVEDFDIKMEPNRQYSITHVTPYPIDILKKNEEETNGESEI